MREVDIGGQMISVVMPYWQRREELKFNLDRYRQLYSDLDLEIVIVDDGSPEPAEADGDYPWPVEIVRLKDKEAALNPCVPFNVGVGKSSGETIVLTNPEVVHRKPILKDMQSRLGPKGYVAAACWGDGWYCRSDVKRDNVAKIPEGAGLHFCAMLERSLYEEVGGFSEEYRGGQGYEDNDFLWKLEVAGAKFLICDDLICDHMKCRRSNWPAGGLKRNREIFEKRWGE